MDFMYQLLSELTAYKNVLSSINKKVTPISITGIGDSARAHIVSSICNNTGRDTLILVSNANNASILKSDLELFFPSDNILLFPSQDYIFYNIEITNSEITHARINCLDRIRNSHEPLIIIATIDAVVKYTLPPALFESYTLSFKIGATIKLNELINMLLEMGYKRCDSVEGIGQFSIRGGIIDIFSPNSASPARIELFDDEVDTIRYFDPLTQLSNTSVRNVNIIPNKEAIYTTKFANEIADELSSFEPMTDEILADITSFREKHYFPASDKYIPKIYPLLYSIIDYMQPNSLVFLDNPARLYDLWQGTVNEVTNTIEHLSSKGYLQGMIGAYIIDIYDLINKQGLIFVGMGVIDAKATFYTAKHDYHISMRGLNSYMGNFDLILEDIRQWNKDGYAINILAGSEQKAVSFCNTLQENDIPAVKSDNSNPAGEFEIIVSDGSLSNGFIYPSIKHIFLSSRELFGTTRRPRKFSTMPGIKIKSYADLSPGDYIVHQVHGIGQYLGMKRIEVDKITKDYLQLTYRDGDLLYVPATAINTINKYVGGEGKNLRLNKMGGTDFAKVKNKVKKAVEDLAIHLVKLYAARQTTKGYSFSKDNDWQKIFEDTFPYVETPDQLRSIEEVKADMESEKVMDRLLCGDVGFGKTEVALRASFKAVNDSKQVAYLVPTTILAQQHYTTFKNRMKDFPINVELLCRFRTHKQQKDILKNTKSGKVDVIIGTHRLLQADVEFYDLGLLIIDEEQHFGVAHKEKIKQLKNNVDVLVLSATPIPRTLNMALTGIRDMSVIAEPPDDRYPVRTFILEHDRDIISDAIEKELSRDGQVYYVYNRVEGIYRVANELQARLPNARIAVGHGQMNERELEDIMLATINGEVDILVCTTIIESGLDIPNINTIIIEQADRLGLSQLYQLRGRVGRSNRLAYAYLTYQKDKSLSEVSIKRLQAIREFTEFGSGFKIALRDLEIRGAGNTLGAQQHGAIDAVGYDMYCNILSDAVKEARGEKHEIKINCSIDIRLDAFIPNSYIDAHNIRLEIYKRISIVQSDEDVSTVIEELIDRFGEPPQCVMNLVDIALIRHLASTCGIEDIVQMGDNIFLYFSNLKPIDLIGVKNITLKLRGYATYGQNKRHFIRCNLQNALSKEILSNIKILLHFIKQLQNDKI